MPINDVNSVIIMGRLTKESELRYTQGGSANCKFTIATNKSYYNANREEIKSVTFINVVTWGKIAESCANYIHKGSKVLVIGSLAQNTWTTKEGQKRTMYIINAQTVHFLDSVKRERTEAQENEYAEKYDDNPLMNEQLDKVEEAVEETETEEKSPW